MLVIDTSQPAWPVVAATDGVSEMTGRAAEEIVGRPWPPLWDERLDADAYLLLTEAVRMGVRARVRVPTVGQEGPRPSEVEVVPAAGGSGGLVVCVVRDGLPPDDLAWLAFHDSLTGLANRSLFERDLDVALSRATREGREVAVLYVDLDEFKLVNDRLGHAAGDGVLREVALRLRRAVRAHDLVARIGGDEFVVALTDIEDDPLAHAAAVARHLSAALEEPIVVDGDHCRVGASIGVSLFPGDAGDRDALLAGADAEMYRSKNLRPAHLRTGPRDRRELLERARSAVREAQALRVATEDRVQATSDVQEQLRSRRLERRGVRALDESAYGSRGEPA
jgi:diguanylate cyclase (GGDEF)-like protein